MAPGGLWMAAPHSISPVVLSPALASLGLDLMGFPPEKGIWLCGALSKLGAQSHHYSPAPSPRQSLNISTGNARLAQGCWSQAEVLKLENLSLALFDFSCFPFAGWIPTLNQWEAIKWSHCSLLPWFSWVNKREGIGLCRHKVKLKAKILFGIHRKIVYNLCYP